MNCFLPWNLKDMTNISAEKLQKNIGQQTSYIEMYRSELLKESIRFNIASLLRYLAINRESFNSDDFSRRATDCLIVFLHAASFLKKAYFAPTDAENPTVGKCVRNLHRLMLENVKATMKYLDYYLLLDIARGKIEESEMLEKRKAIHDQIFPGSEIPVPFKNDTLGAKFLRLAETESSNVREFADLDVQKNSNLSTEICQALSGTTRRDDDLPESRFGIIGSCRSYLDTPFIKYGNSYYSLVVPYSLRRIAELTEGFELQVEPEAEPESVAEPETVAESEIETEPEPVVETAPEPEPEIEPTPEPSSEPKEDTPFDEDDEIEVETGEGDTLASDDDSAYYETDEYEFPDEYEEDTSNSEEAEPEPEDVYEESEDIPDESNQPVNPNDDSYYDEEPYTALVSPDTYDYLDQAEPDEFTQDPILEEQESLEDAYDDDDEETQDEETSEDDEPDPYSGSLFDFIDDSDEEESAPEKETKDFLEPEEENEEQDDSFPPFEEEESEPEPAVALEPVIELKSEPEPEPTPEPEPEPEAPATVRLPLLEQILSYSPSRNNPITQYLTSCSPENQKEIVRVIELARKSWLIDGRDKMFTIPDTSISVAVFSETHDPMMDIQRRENIGAVMYSASKDMWNSLELSYDKSGQLAKADFNRISKSDFTDWEWKVVEKLGNRIIERRSK